MAFDIPKISDNDVSPEEKTLSYELEEVSNDYHQSNGTDDSEKIDFLKNGDLSDVQKDLKQTIDWIQQCANGQHLDSSGSEHSIWKNYNKLSPAIIRLMDKNNTSHDKNKLANDIKTHMILHTDTPFAVWTVWMCWLESKNHQNLLKALNSRYSHRFGIIFPVGQVVHSDYQNVPDIVVDTVDMFLAQAETPKAQENLLLTWLESKAVPAYMLANPAVYLHLMSYVGTLNNKTLEPVETAAVDKIELNDPSLEGGFVLNPMSLD